MKAPLGIIAAVALLASGCGSTDEGVEVAGTPVRPINQAITVRASEWKFEPNYVELTLGQQVTVSFENRGEVVHNLRIDDLDAELIESGEDGEVFVEADEGDSADLVFTPEEEGSFTYYCDVPDHRDLGMEGVLVIVAGPAPTAPGPGAPPQAE